MDWQNRCARWAARLGLAAALVLGTAAQAQHADDGALRWVSAWGTAQQLAPQPAPKMPPPEVMARFRAMPKPPVSPIPPIPQQFSNQTLRMIARTSIAGNAVRVQLSNAAGAEPLVIAEVRLAKSKGASRIDPASDHALTFGGQRAVTIEPGQIVTSDPVELAVPAFQDLAVSLYVPGAAKAATVHPLGLRTTYVVAGNATAAPELAGATTNRSYFWLAGIDVRAAGDAHTIVAFGDSITDGFMTTPDASKAWPDLLAQRLQADPKTAGWSVINMGIAGNRIRRDGAGLSALARFDRDVLSRPGASWMILLLGINDINMAAFPNPPEADKVTADQLITAYRQVIAKAHLHGVKVMGATILPTNGLWLYSDQTEVTRTAVNAWIRSSGEFDAVADFDAVTRDPAQPNRLRPEFDPGDHVHPNDAGNAAMAGAIGLAVFARP
jgi:lysophospholipase L1-like esterase